MASPPGFEEALARIRAALAACAPRPLAVEGFRPAAVLVPLLSRASGPTLLFTRRTERVPHHKGEISFPGGGREPGEDAVTAALREAEEEVGLRRADVDLLGRLSETLVLQSAFRLTPWVASVPYPYAYAADPGEVDEILHVPLSALERPEIHRVEPREVYGMNLDVHFFTLGDDVLRFAPAAGLFEAVPRALKLDNKTLDLLDLRSKRRVLSSPGTVRASDIVYISPAAFHEDWQAAPGRPWAVVVLAV